MRVAAGVVTYNRAALLTECVRALLGQTQPVDRVFIVDNASTDGTPEHLRAAGLLDDPRVVYDRQERNLGGAGGFARAVKLARGEGAQWLWLMDDDAEPRPDALERLLASPWAEDPATVALAQTVVNPDGSIQLGARGHIGAQVRGLAVDEHVDGAELDYATFVGILARGDAARAEELPKAEFFIWCDDFEWCMRLRRHGAIRLVRDSEIVHKDAGHGFSTRRGELVNRLTGWRFGATPYSGFWRNICGIRNFVWLRKEHMGDTPVDAAGTVARFAFKALLYDERPLARLPWILRAGIDGRRGRFDTITPEEWNAELARQRARRKALRRTLSARAPADVRRLGLARQGSVPRQASQEHPASSPKRQVTTESASTGQAATALVCAAIVTYNRKELLAECLESVLAQTHAVSRVFVIDNASTDGTEQALAERGLTGRPEVEFVRLDSNLGGAGGFARAIEIARDTACDWIWLMDDDSEPVPDSLERLLESPSATDPETVAVCSKVQLADGRIDANQRGYFRRRLISLPDSEYRPGHHPSIGFLSFVGSAIRRDAALRTELPRAEFFVWGDDVEYSMRLRRLGEIRLVPESVMRHKRVTHSYENRRSRFWNRILPGEYWPTPLERFWQNLCGLRNYIWTKRVYERQGGLSAAGTTLQFIIKSLLYDEQPLRRIPWIVRFARAGRRGSFDNIAPSEWVRMVREGRI